MSKKETAAKLAQTKTALAEKYYNLAKLSKSKPKQVRYLHHADQYRRQAEELSRS
jgi:hypothetical protein